jgi:hypothetical protein
LQDDVRFIQYQPKVINLVDVA